MIEQVVYKMTVLSVTEPFKNESKEALIRIAIEIIKLEKLEAIRKELKGLYDVV